MRFQTDSTQVQELLHPEPVISKLVKVLLYPTSVYSISVLLCSRAVLLNTAEGLLSEAEAPIVPRHLLRVLLNPAENALVLMCPARVVMIPARASKNPAQDT